MQQSALSPGGSDAEAIATLSWVMFGGATAIFIAVVAFIICAHWGNASLRRRIASQQFILVGGVVFPVVTLTALLFYGLMLTGARVGTSEPDALTVEVTAEQWWWRVVYRSAGDQTPAATANEIRIPVRRQVELTLRSADVIHSFWVPSLAGKVDMIPGTVNSLRLRAGNIGTYRGQCAEYCGGPHALMAFHVVVLEPAQFETWHAGQRQPAAAQLTALQKQGESLFLSTGCGGCHAIRGTKAAGMIGPDLTHVGGRLAIAAATLPNNAVSLARWIGDGQHIKPNSRMPAFAILSTGELAALGAYLENLR